MVAWRNVYGQSTSVRYASLSGKIVLFLIIVNWPVLCCWCLRQRNPNPAKSHLSAWSRRTNLPPPKGIWQCRWRVLSTIAPFTGCLIPLMIYSCSVRRVLPIPLQTLSMMPDRDDTMTTMLYLNGTIYTMDAGQPVAQAIAIDSTSGRILAVGTDDEVRRVGGRFTEVYDLGGKTVLPGFIDAHIHLLATA